jgi:SAM-dependent methyltransferase
MPAPPRVQLGAVEARYGEPSAPCPACGRESGSCVVDYPDQVPNWQALVIIICNHCGFGYVPSIHFDLDEYYATGYGGSRGRRSLPEPGQLFGSLSTNDTPKVARARWHAGILHDLGGRIDSILDIGSGPGFLLWHFPKARRLAVESDQFSRPYLDHLQVEILDGAEDAPGGLDVIALSHVLEHIPIEGVAPLLDTCRSKLRPGGKLLIEVPEWGFLHHRRPKKGSQVPHVLFFSPRSLLEVAASGNSRLRYFQTPQRVLEVRSDGSIDWQRFHANESTSSVLMAVWEAE